MAAYQLVIECPFCGQILKIKSPNRLNCAYCTTKPSKGKYKNKLIQQKIKCQNPKCKKTTTLYWYQPMNYLKI